MALLRLDRQRGDRARIEPLQADRLAGLLAVAVRAVLDAGERGIDLGDELALPVARPELERAVGLRGGAVGEIGVLVDSSCRPASVSRVWRMISSFQATSFWRK